MSAENLTEVLEDELFGPREQLGSGSYPRSAGDYLNDWADNSRGWLRKLSFCPEIETTCSGGDAVGHGRNAGCAPVFPLPAGFDVLLELGALVGRFHAPACASSSGSLDRDPVS